MNVAHPVSKAVEALPGTQWLTQYVNIGAIVGLASVVLVLLLAQSRIFYAMGRDGMIPEAFHKIHPRFRTPYKSSIITGIFSAILAGFLPLDILGQLVSIGTLAAFAIVCVGVMVLRVRAPHAKRPFRTPLVWVTAPLGHRDVPVHDGLPAARHLAQAGGVDRDRIGDLLRLFVETRQAEQICGEKPGAGVGA